MATTAKILAQGQLSATPDTVLYTVPASTKTYITAIYLVNTNGSARTFNIKIGTGSTFYHIYGKDVSLASNAGVEVAGDPQRIRLQTSYKITGDASAGTSISYTIVGIEYT